MQAVVRRLVDDGKQIAADPVHVRLDETHHGIGRDGRVHGVAAALEHLNASARGQRLAGGDDAVLRGDLRSACDNIHAVWRLYYSGLGTV